MTRKSKREIERVLEDLDEGLAAPLGEPFAEQTYDEPLRGFVYQLTRDVDRLGLRHGHGNLKDPERARVMLEALRERYGIDDDRDDDVLAALQAAAEQVPSTHWTTSDVLPAAVQYGPEFLDDGERRRFEAAFVAGREDEAAALAVRATYDWFADRGGAAAVVDVQT